MMMSVVKMRREEDACGMHFWDSTQLPILLFLVLDEVYME